jgi:ABC-type dipeptide/oligopeptide/nickel transport system permease component
MISYIIRRILLVVPIILVVLTLVFLLIRVVPGDPAVAALGDYASKEAIEAFRQRMGLDAPLWLQYFRYLSGVFRGDLGRSFITGVPVASQVASVLPYTLELTLAGLLFGVVFGIPLGILSAIRRNTLVDYLSRTFSLAGLSIPAFYLGILLILLFAVYLRLFPAVGAGSFSDPLDNLRHLFLPALTLGLIMTAFTARMSRSAMLNILQEDYIRTARSKGLAEWVVLYGHAFRNALIPIVTIVGIYAIVLIGSSVMTEIVFSRPGLGRLLVGAMKQRDYNTLQSVMVIYTGFVVFINLLTDLVYGIVDPRISYE